MRDGDGDRSPLSRRIPDRVATLLRELYVNGEPDPLAVILGATSLDEAMAGIEELSRATASNERLAAEAEERARRLESLTRIGRSPREPVEGPQRRPFRCRSARCSRRRQARTSDLRRSRALTDRAADFPRDARAAKQVSDRRRSRLRRRTERDASIGSTCRADDSGDSGDRLARGHAHPRRRRRRLPPAGKHGERLARRSGVIAVDRA